MSDTVYGTYQPRHDAVSSGGVWFPDDGPFFGAVQQVGQLWHFTEKHLDHVAKKLGLNDWQRSKAGETRREQQNYRQRVVGEVSPPVLVDCATGEILSHDSYASAIGLKSWRATSTRHGVKGGQEAVGAVAGDSGLSVLRSGSWAHRCHGRVNPH